MSKKILEGILRQLDVVGFLFNSDDIAKDAAECDEFKTAIGADVRNFISELSPYRLSLVCGDSSTHISIVKLKMRLSGGGAAVASYGICSIPYRSVDGLELEEYKGENFFVIKSNRLKGLVMSLYDSTDDKKSFIDLVKKYINLSSPTFETEGNALFSEDAEKMSLSIFDSPYDPIDKTIFKINEDDMIYRDLYSSGHGELLEDLTGHVRYMTEQGRILDIINVNRKEGEAALGVDLIYYVKEFRSIVMLQYKRITSGTYYAGSDGNYQKEVERMVSTRDMFAIPGDVRKSISHKYFRLSACPYYFKICPESSKTTHKYVSGACIHLDHWLSLMESELCQTRNGNCKLGYEELNDRYLRANEFISLTKRGMLGGHIAGLTELANLIKKLKNEKRIVVTSIESPKSGYVDI